MAACPAVPPSSLAETTLSCLFHPHRFYKALWGSVHIHIGSYDMHPTPPLEEACHATGVLLDGLLAGLSASVLTAVFMCTHACVHARVYRFAAAACNALTEDAWRLVCFSVVSHAVGQPASWQ